MGNIFKRLFESSARVPVSKGKIRMRRSTVALTAMLAVVATGPARGTEPVKIDGVAWLQGCWLADSPQRTIEEHWMAPRGGVMLGMGRTVRGDAMAEYELVVLRQRGGQLVYQAHPSGQPSAEFPLRELTDTSVLFENLQHDFPQRVGYRRDGSGLLLAWIEGTSKGQLRRIEFAYRRVACPGAVREGGSIQDRVPGKK
jgi:hypothetical protein